MIGTIKAIWDWLVGLPMWFVGVIVAIFTSLTDLGKDLFCWIFDELMGLVVVLLNSLPQSFAQFDPTSYFSALPSGLVNAASYIHLPAAMAMVVSALIIRFFLQLIPFVRLGS